MCLWFNQKYLSGYTPDYSTQNKENKRMTELLKKVNYGNPDETSLETANVLTYELGDLIKMLFYSKIYPDRKKMHMIEAKIAMSDLLTQCNVICDREGWNFEETHAMGIKRLIERIDRRIQLGE